MQQNKYTMYVVAEDTKRGTAFEQVTKVFVYSWLAINTNKFVSQSYPKLNTKGGFQAYAGKQK